VTDAGFLCWFHELVKRIALKPKAKLRCTVVVAEGPVRVESTGAGQKVDKFEGDRESSPGPTDKNLEFRISNVSRTR
jgi:hypothetical protein